MSVYCCDLDEDQIIFNGKVAYYRKLWFWKHRIQLFTSRAKPRLLKSSQAPHTSLARFPWAERHFCTGIRRILGGVLVCRQEEEENSFVEQEDVSFWTNACKHFHNSAAGYVWNVTSSQMNTWLMSETSGRKCVRRMSGVLMKVKSTTITYCTKHDVG